MVGDDGKGSTPTEGGAGGAIGFSVRYQGELLADLGPSKSWSTSKITPRNQKNRLTDYLSLWALGMGVLKSAENVLTMYVHIGLLNSGRNDSPHIRKSSLDHDIGGENGCYKGREEAKRVASGGWHFRPTSDELH